MAPRLVISLFALLIACGRSNDQSSHNNTSSILRSLIRGNDLVKENVTSLQNDGQKRADVNISKSNLRKQSKADKTSSIIDATKNKPTLTHSNELQDSIPPPKTVIVSTSSSVHKDDIVTSSTMAHQPQPQPPQLLTPRVDRKNKEEKEKTHQQQEHDLQQDILVVEAVLIMPEDEESITETTQRTA
jgi:hypothetical protein